MKSEVVKFQLRITKYISNIRNKINALYILLVNIRMLHVVNSAHSQIKLFIFFRLRIYHYTYIFSLRHVNVHTEFSSNRNRRIMYARTQFDTHIDKYS